MVKRDSIGALAAGLVLLGAVGAGAEIYTWTDATGRVHFTEDLSRVPAQHRPDARGNAVEEGIPGRVQTYSAPPAARAPRSAAASTPRVGRTHRIRVERAGNGMMVPVSLNGGPPVPFLIDTGASYVLIPQSVADRQGIDPGPAARRERFSTANGIVEHTLVMLDSVQLGSARAEGVPAALSPSMTFGLLGLSFFNRFTYQIDAASGLVTLTENGLAESGVLRGGRSESQWRGEFRSLEIRLAENDVRQTRTPSSRSRAHDRLDQEREALEEQLEQLHGEADRARVPDAWRR